jgi:hypothetical protein
MSFGGKRMEGKVRKKKNLRNMSSRTKTFANTGKLYLQYIRLQGVKIGIALEGGKIFKTKIQSFLLP